MSKDIFNFKQFSVDQSLSVGMKVGTDGVLLGAWCRIDPAHKRFLDVGTGTGLIALMLAQRAANARIDALEINSECCEQAYLNAEASPWRNRITIINRSVQSYAIDRLHNSKHNESNRSALAAWAGRPMLYDHIVSNPPYFTESLLSPSLSRATARHDVALPHRDLAESAAALLAHDGILSLILPIKPAENFIEYASAHGLYLLRADEVRPKTGELPKRMLMEFGHKPKTDVERNNISIREATSDSFTEEYKALTRDFYLKF